MTRKQAQPSFRTQWRLFLLLFAVCTTTQLTHEVASAQPVSGTLFANQTHQVYLPSNTWMCLKIELTCFDQSGQFPDGQCGVFGSDGIYLDGQICSWPWWWPSHENPWYICIEGHDDYVSWTLDACEGSVAEWEYDLSASSCVGYCGP